MGNICFNQRLINSETNCVQLVLCMPNRATLNYDNWNHRHCVTSSNLLSVRLIKFVNTRDTEMSKFETLVCSLRVPNWSWNKITWRDLVPQITAISSVAHKHQRQTIRKLNSEVGLSRTTSHGAVRASQLIYPQLAD